ncbi:hypothetical protein HCUR_00754 [Holospora curviuscula]|uniref:Uncharacterized protein n=1 Tax=Holospora curviuscula TaxID=1082868 RepID=A0A2S5R8U2_9PROT|nr:hypothetical protein HCUR_00754 [Holospora curviuscula]
MNKGIKILVFSQQIGCALLSFLIDGMKHDLQLKQILAL